MLTEKEAWLEIAPQWDNAIKDKGMCYISFPTMEDGICGCIHRLMDATTNETRESMFKRMQNHPSYKGIGHFFWD